MADERPGASAEASPEASPGTSPGGARKGAPAPIRVGVDTGGTFTDVVVSGPGGVRAFKVASTPDDPSRAILAGLDAALAPGASEADAYGASPVARIELVHGTTVGTNALLERAGARVAFVATEGFEDVLAIGRQARPELYNLLATRPDPLVPPERCFGLAGRVDVAGRALAEPEAEELERVARAVAASGAESVAVCLLFSFANPAHERALEDRLVPLGIPVSSSHRILPEYREYERAATTVVNAYLAPRMRGYLARLAAEAARRGVGSVRVMQSSGGSTSAETASREPVRTILSGPAGGAVAAAHVAREAGLGDVVTFDMGGTSTDVALVANGAARVTSEAIVAGLPVSVPVVDIHTVGAGGGSIASVDAGGALRVGPESAGADPGPACYGRGERPTVTDANVVLGRLPAGLLGGAFRLDAGRARAAMSELARALGAASGEASGKASGEASGKASGKASGGDVSPEEAALGVVRVASANMERALRVVSVERGYDPRGAALLSFGGAGGLHACALAEALGMRRVVVPPLPGAFSALGLLLGDVVRDFGRTVLGSVEGARGVGGVLDELESEARAAMASEGVAPERLRVERTVALRYAGQSFEIDVPWGERAESHFHRAHRARYGHADPARRVEIVHARVRAVGELDRPALARSPDAVAHPAESSGFAPVILDDGEVHDVPTFDRSALLAGARADGPALVVEYGSTTLVPPGWRFEVDVLGCLSIQSTSDDGTDADAPAP